MQTAQRLAALFQHDLERVQSLGRGAANALRVLTELRQRPLGSVRQLGHHAHMTFPTVSKAMLAPVDLGIARELTGLRRNRVFVYDTYLNILNEGSEPL